jgi:hypothetical protein
MSRRPVSPARVYRWPLLVAALVALGLAAALSGGGAARIFSWLALAAPLAVILVCLFLGGRRQSSISPER